MVQHMTANIKADSGANTSCLAPYQDLPPGFLLAIFIYGRPGTISGWTADFLKILTVTNPGS